MVHLVINCTSLTNSLKFPKAIKKFINKITRNREISSSKPTTTGVIGTFVFVHYVMNG